MSFHKKYIFNNEIKGLSDYTASDYISKLYQYLQTQAALTNNFDIVTRDYTSGDYTYYCLFIAPKNRYKKLSEDEDPTSGDKIVIFTNNSNSKVGVNVGGYTGIGINTATALGHLTCSNYSTFSMILNCNDRNEYRIVFYASTSTSDWISIFYVKNSIGELEYVNNYSNSSSIRYSQDNQASFKSISLSNIRNIQSDPNKYLRPLITEIEVFPNLYQVINLPQGLDVPYVINGNIYIEACGKDYQGLAMKY